MSDTRIAWLQIHLCVFLWGFTAIIGKLIALPALPLVLWRMVLVSLMLLLLPRVWRGVLRLSRRHLLAFLGVGVIVAVHWLTFYAAVKLANASVAATCMALIPVCLCFIEPMVTGRAFERRELFLGLLVLPGVALVVGGTPDTMNAGIAVAILSAFLAALFTAYNKRLIHRTDALSATALEMLGGGAFALALTPAALCAAVDALGRGGSAADTGSAAGSARGERPVLDSGAGGGLYAAALRPVAGGTASALGLCLVTGSEHGAALRDHSGHPDSR